MENKQANKQKTSDRNGHGRRTTTTEIWKRKAVAEDWNEGKGTGTTTQAWPRTGENKIEQQELRVQPEEAMQLKRIINQSWELRLKKNWKTKQSEREWLNWRAQYVYPSWNGKSLMETPWNCIWFATYYLLYTTTKLCKR